MPRSSVSDETTSARAARAAAASPGVSTSRSVPLNFTNAAVACRCSASIAPIAIGRRRAGGTRPARSPAGRAPPAAAAAHRRRRHCGAGTRRRVRAATSPSRASAVRAETSTSPDSAASSSPSVADAAGPQTISSRRDRPTRKKWHGPDAIPAAMPRRTGPTLDSLDPDSATSACIARAARAVAPRGRARRTAGATHRRGTSGHLRRSASPISIKPE